MVQITDFDESFILWRSPVRRPVPPMVVTPVPISVVPALSETNDAAIAVKTREYAEAPRGSVTKPAAFRLTGLYVNNLKATYDGVVSGSKVFASKTSGNKVPGTKISGIKVSGEEVLGDKVIGSKTLIAPVMSDSQQSIKPSNASVNGDVVNASVA